MISSKIKSFDCYGAGWIFDGGNNVNVNFDKLAMGKGYTVQIQHFGILDPVLGDFQSENPWCEDADFILWLLKTTNNTKNFLETEQAKDILETTDLSDIKDVVDECIERDPSYYILDAFESLGLCKEDAIFGVTDEDYLQTLAKGANIDLSDDDVEIVFLD